MSQILEALKKKRPMYPTLDLEIKEAFLAQFDNPEFSRFFYWKMQVLCATQLAKLTQANLSLSEAIEAGNIFLAAKGMVHAYKKGLIHGDGGKWNDKDENGTVDEKLKWGYRPPEEYLRRYIEVALEARHRIPQRFALKKPSSTPRNVPVEDFDVLSAASMAYNDLHRALEEKQVQRLFPDDSHDLSLPPSRAESQMGRRAAIGAIAGLLTGAALGQAAIHKDDFTPSSPPAKNDSAIDWENVALHASFAGICAALGAMLGAASVGVEFDRYNAKLDKQVNAKVLEQVFPATAQFCLDQATKGSSAERSL